MPLIDRDVPIVMPDGIRLATDLYHPDGPGPFPTLLQRTCYGKDLIAEYSGLHTFVDAGYRVVLQDCRGSGASEGTPDHFAEAVDGRTTGDWIAQKPWFDGALGTFGSSYMGMTQWALASTRPPYLKAMAVGLVNAKGGRSWFPGGSLALGIFLSWTQTRVYDFVEAQTPAVQQRLKDAFMHLPMRDADQVATGGQTLPWYQRWMDHPSADDPFWKPLDFSDGLELDIPVLLIDQWYDYATVHLTREFTHRQDAGLPTRLHIGPGTHFSGDERQSAEMLTWFDVHLKGKQGPPAGGVSVYVLPDVGWRELASWPPRAQDVPWYLHPSGGLAGEAPTVSSPTSFVYDPADPTPSVGGPSLFMNDAGPVDNRPLEARPDVVTFTSDPLTLSTTSIGQVQADLHLSSDVDHFDVYLRLCDVAPTGESINVCEVIRRLKPSDIERDEKGVFSVKLEMWPVAVTFAPGHRIRLQVSGGAHPMFARNTCSDEPPADAVQLVVAHCTIHHDPTHPSRIVLRRPEDVR